MPAIAFDTYKMIKRLRESGFTDAQAEGVVAVVQEGSVTDLSHLATKADLAETKAELKADIAAVEHRLDNRISEVKASLAETKSDILKVIITVMVVNSAVVLAAMFGLAKLLGH